MNREKLVEEAEGWLNKWELCNKCENKVNCISNFSYCKKVVLKSYLASAESRDKQIEIDAEQIQALQKQNGELTDKVKKLEQQIEKMKNWCNCKNYQKCLIELAEQGKGMKPSECCINCKKWEIKENDL